MKIFQRFEDDPAKKSKDRAKTGPVLKMIFKWVLQVIGNRMPGDGIEPPTQGFSVLRSTD